MMRGAGEVTRGKGAGEGMTMEADASDDWRDQTCFLNFLLPTSLIFFLSTDRYFCVIPFTSSLSIRCLFLVDFPLLPQLCIRNDHHNSLSLFSKFPIAATIVHQ